MKHFILQFCTTLLNKGVGFWLLKVAASTCTLSASQGCLEQAVTGCTDESEKKFFFSTGLF